MSMIVCPNCGKEISDKASKCVHCGVTIKNNEEINKCVECGAELDAEATECPNCGCPVEKRFNLNDSGKIYNGIVKNKKVIGKNKIIIGIVIVVFAIVSLIGIKQYKNKKANEEYEQRVTAYSTELKSVSYAMLSGAGDAETCGNLIKQVWSNTIYRKSDDETDKYTKEYTKDYGYGRSITFVPDFNDALENLFSDEDFSSKIKSIKDGQETVQSSMKALKNPPEEYKDAYEKLTELYDAYLSFTNIVVSPSGSLQTFSENLNDADEEVLNCYNTMELYLDE